MRVMAFLLLGLCLALPARAADGGPVVLLPGLSGPATEAAPGYRCADFLEEAGLKPEGLEYLFCRPAVEPRTGRRTLTARYRVPGAQAAAVETALRERTGMAALHRQAGIWQLPEGGEGRFAPRRGAGEDSPGGMLSGPFLSAGRWRDGRSGTGNAGSGAGALPSAGISVPAAKDGPAGDGGSGAAGRLAAVAGAAAGEGMAADREDSVPDAGPCCTVGMGEVPQQGTFAAQREDWGKVAWFAVTVRVPLPR